MRTIFLRVLEADDKSAALLSAVREPVSTQSRRRFDVNSSDFSKVPGTPFCYWVSERLTRLFVTLSPFESGERTANVGLQTSDDTRFLRAWWETSSFRERTRWFPFAKGGVYSPFYSDLQLVIKWERDGADAAELKAFVESIPGTTHWSRSIRNVGFYFRPGLTWPLRAIRFAPHVLPRGSVFSVRGYCAFVPEVELLSTLAVFNSCLFDYLFKVALGRHGFPEFVVGILQSLPWQAVCNGADQHALNILARRAWSVRRSLDTRNEASRAFVEPALLQGTGCTFTERADSWTHRTQIVAAELMQTQASIDARTFELYDIADPDRRAIVDGFAEVGAVTDESSKLDGDVESESAEVDTISADTNTLAAELLSWSIGVAFGRFDVRLATGARPLPPEPEPFDPLPVCSPGMLTGDDGLPVSAPPPGYPLAFPDHGLLVDDPGHAHDLTAAVRAVFDVVFGANADARWEEAAALLDPKSRDLRGWLARDFFEFHLKRYSKSRRKAPIYWQLATPSGRYAVWLYAHRLTPDTWFQLQNDVVAKKLAYEEGQLRSLRDAAGNDADKAQRKELAARESLVDELRAMLEEVKRVAPLWKPDLDDGVVLTTAPLWRLVPQHAAWQKELKAAWDGLCDAQYDWAKVAMHLWPERVVPACTTDRSFAIAHGLEDHFWVQDFDEKWRARRAIDETIGHVIARHTSRTLEAAVAALRSFWQATYADTGRDDRDWWLALEAGAHDDAPLALAWWPERVVEKARTDRELARAHGLPWEETAMLPGASKPAGGRKKARDKRASLLTSAQLSLVAAFCGDLEGDASWAARWQALDAGAFDERSPLALRVRTRDVVARALESREVALTFGLERWFWLDTEEGARRLREPEAEVREALKRRESPAVREALKSLREAPQAGGGKKAKKGRSDA